MKKILWAFVLFNTYIFSEIRKVENPNEIIFVDTTQNIYAIYNRLSGKYTAFQKQQISVYIDIFHYDKELENAELIFAMLLRQYGDEQALLAQINRLQITDI